MRANVMSAGVLTFGRQARTAKQQRPLTKEQILGPTAGWNEGRFAQEQLLGLVRQVFASEANPAIRQVVFSAVEPETNIETICLRVGEVLAEQRAAEVIVVTRGQTDAFEGQRKPGTCVREQANRLNRNLFAISIAENGGIGTKAESMQGLLAQIRDEFEYSIVAIPSGGANGAATFAQVADGMILVLSALRTRRAAARRLLEQLSHVRVLGTVLQDREFPMPERIYRRL